ncbi:MAG: tRNA pseudouridine(55) synthase TruB [Nitratiruptor sp.]|nr:tRNA pseudouridine(55) synthase TruB [Nitratiruptor sp.]NPA83766.1 tRNA pseudouridine(55) synthase TruB [Campylobacterota bacterium]
MNRLFVAYKPPYTTSNTYLSHLKRRYKVKKGGFSGILDPFACGTLVVAFGAYTRLFPYLRKYPKRYRATLWLGTSSPTLDIEGIEAIREIPPIPLETILQTLANFQGPFTYTPPLFSAKKIGGKRAYQLAHQGKSLQLDPITSTIYQLRLVNYTHPFLTFEALVSEGTYIRSLAAAIAQALGTTGVLSYLERLQEGAFAYDQERPLDPLDYLLSTPNQTTLPPEAIAQGHRIRLQDLALRDDGLYHLVFDHFFTIVEVADGKVFYRLNKVPRSSSAN